MNHYLPKVREFHQRFFVVRSGGFHMATPQMAQLRHALIQEEFSEYLNATSPIDRLDALCDLMYVVAGTADVLSLQAGVIANIPLANAIGDLTSELLKHPLCQQGLTRGLSKSYPAIELLGQQCSNFFAAFDEVHRSNMSKLWTTEQIQPLVRDADKDFFLVDSLKQLWVCRNKAGKVIKPPTYSPAQLEQYLKV